MIDEDRTMQLYGYTSDMLKPKSNKPIVKVCDECGEYKVVPKYAYRNLCGSCSHKRPQKLSKPKFVKEADRFIPNTQIDRILTIEKFGYDPIDLKPRSNRKVIRICKECRKIREITYFNYNNLCKSCVRKGENSPDWKGGLITKICEICSKEFKSAQSENRKFCSVKCYGEWISINQKGSNNPNWRGGITDTKYCSLFNEKFKELIRDRFHRICYLCFKTEFNNNQKLSVHHVNYNKNCLCGSNCEFVPLCKNCHSKTGGNRQTWEDLIMCYLYSNRYFMVDI